MAVIYLDHPKHGSKVACAESEALADEKNGWVRRKLAALLQAAPEAARETENPPANALIRTEPDADELVSLRIRYEAKTGTKPHHRKSAATLRAELAE
jgi:hypothetical protein